MSLKSILDNLAIEERRRLIHAFDNRVTQFVKLPDNHFVGVYVEDIPNFKIEEQTGVWSHGTIKKM